MPEYNDIDVSKALSAPGGCLSLSALEKFKHHRDGTFDLVHWYRLDTPYPRFKVGMFNEEIIESMKSDNSLVNAVPYLQKALAMGVKYLEFVPGEDEKIYSMAEAKIDSLPKDEINTLLSMSIPEILTISFFINEKPRLLPRLFCDSWDVKRLIEKKELRKTWDLYHLVCSIDAAYLELTPYSK